MDSKTRINMNKTKQTISMIGYRPTYLESMKIKYIGQVFDLTNCSVVREVMAGHWTLDELHSIARQVRPEQYGATLPYLRKTYDTKKSIDRIVREGNSLYSKTMLGIDEPEEPTTWEIIPVNKTSK
jgi:hypothetical protein